MVRPTGDRVREALFDILGESVRGGRFLDLFAGSGAVGIEAHSRGAARVVLVESDREALGAIERNLVSLGLTHCIGLVRTPWPRALDAAVSSLGSLDIAGGGSLLSRTITIVFADPPYEGAPYPEILETLSRPGLFASHAVVVLEHQQRAAVPRSGGRLELTRIASYGRAALAFYRSQP